MNNSDRMEALFQYPIKLEESVMYQKFYSKSTDDSYLLLNKKKSFKINKEIYNIIISISENANIEDVTTSFNQRLNYNYTPNDIIRIINNVLVPNGIVKPIDQIEISEYNSFLTFKRTLIPQEAVQIISNYFKIFYSPFLAITLIVVILLSHFYFLLNIKNFDVLKNLLVSPSYFGVSIIFFTLSMIFHEFGHSSACSFYGVKPKEIGFGIYLQFAVFYSNINESWKLTPNKRIVIDLGGIFFQYILNLVFIVCYLITKNNLYLAVLYFIVIQTLFTLNPFLRYDGYWFVSDLLGVPNLRKNSTLIITNLFYRFILRKKNKNILLNISPISLAVFYIYSVISNTFFILFFYFVIRYIPSTIYNMGDFVKNAYSDISAFFHIHNYGKVLLVIYKVLMQFFMIFLSVHFTFRVVRRIVRFITTLIQNKSIVQ